MTNASELLDFDLAQMQAMVDEIAAIADMAAAADMENEEGSAIDRLCAIARHFGIEETDWTHGDLADAINVETARLYRAQVTQLEAQLAEVREAIGQARRILLYPKNSEMDDNARLTTEAVLAVNDMLYAAVDIDLLPEIKARALLSKEPK